MSTTTIRIPDELKERVARAAERTGKSPHSFILEAISEKAEAEERQADFVATAEKRYDAIVASGKTIPWAEMRRVPRAPRCGRSDRTAQGASTIEMTGSVRIEFAPDVAGDVDRILGHLLEHEVNDAAARVHDIVTAIDVLERNPLIGRPQKTTSRNS
jgi:predicted transcriptional regulator